MTALVCASAGRLPPERRTEDGSAGTKTCAWRSCCHRGNHPRSGGPCGPWTQKSNLNVRNSEIHLSPARVIVVFAHRFPLLQVFLFAESIKTSHMFRFGTQGEHIRVGNVC